MVESSVTPIEASPLQSTSRVDSNLQNQIDSLEAAIPILADDCFAKARQAALKAGLSVLHAEGGAIYSVSPNGQKIRVKTISPPVRVKTGATYRLP